MEAATKDNVSIAKGVAIKLLQHRIWSNSGAIDHVFLIFIELCTFRNPNGAIRRLAEYWPEHWLSMVSLASLQDGSVMYPSAMA